MIILALDLTSEFGSLAVRSGGVVAAAVAIHSSEGFAHLVFAAITQVLNQAGVDLRQVDCFASANGPGAFTGVRVGLSTVKGLAEASGKAAAGISNLRALSTFGRTEAQRAVVLDARRGEIFGAVYDGECELVAPEMVARFDGWLESLLSSRYEFVFQHGFALPTSLQGTRFEGRPTTEAPRHLAEAIALCAELDGERGMWSDPAALDANYVRRSDAELFWRDR